MLLKIGHRGAMGYEPENTLRSFATAVKMKVDMIELDVHCCKSGEVIVIHDATLERTTNGRGRVAEMTLSDLKLLDAGRGEHIPTLAEVIEVFCGKVKINVELKGSRTEQSTVTLIEQSVTFKKSAYDDFLISSFDLEQLESVRALNSKIRRSLIMKEPPSSWQEVFSRIDLYSLHLYIDLIDKAILQQAHTKGLKVFVWTVDEPQNILQMKLFGVDGIFSNFPDRLNDIR